MSKSRTSNDTGQLTLFAALDLFPQGDGTFHAVPRKPVVLASITDAARSSGLSRDRIYRLFLHGFIAGDQSSPGKIMIDMASLAEHKQQSQEPGYWTPARRRQYRGG